MAQSARLCDKRAVYPEALAVDVACVHRDDQGPHPGAEIGMVLPRREGGGSVLIQVGLFSCHDGFRVSLPWKWQRGHLTSLGFSVSQLCLAQSTSTHFPVNTFSP